jgi:hypothetical protein
MSAFYDLADLVLVPSGYKSGKIYAQKPLTTDGQLTFTRASTATRVNASGLIETVASGVPRLDYLGSSCPKLQLEPQRSNLQIWSEQHDNANWAKLNLTVSANQGTAPDGTATADLVYPSTGVTNVQNYNSQTKFGLTIGASYTQSVFLKSSGFTWAIVDNANGASGAWFNLVNGTIGTVVAGSTAKIENYGNGWYRCSVTSAPGGTTGYGDYRLASADNNDNVTANGTNGILAWGFQFELGAYGTSYVKTEAATVTRLADAAFKASASSVLSNSTGTLFLEVERQGASGADPENLIFTSDTSLSNFVNIVFSPASNRYRAQVRQGGTTTGSAEASSAYTGKIKIAAAWAANDLVLYINGVLQATDTSVTIPSATFNSFGLGSYYDGAYGPDTFRGKYSQSLIFKTRLTNAQLAELTTL